MEKKEGGEEIGQRVEGKKELRKEEGRKAE